MFLCLVAWTAVIKSTYPRMLCSSHVTSLWEGYRHQVSRECHSYYFTHFVTWFLIGLYYVTWFLIGISLPLNHPDYRIVSFKDPDHTCMYICSWFDCNWVSPERPMSYYDHVLPVLTSKAGFIKQMFTTVEILTELN